MKLGNSGMERRIKFGPRSAQMSSMSDDDIFLSRLKLLIIMAKAYLKGFPLGTFRKQAIIENANHVFYQSLHLLDESTFFKHSQIDAQTNIASKEKSPTDHQFRRRVQSLSVLTKSITNDLPMDLSTKTALSDNLNKLSETLAFKCQINTADFLKVA